MEVVYQAERDVVEIMHRTREKIHAACQSHLHRHVRIMTIDNEVYEGQIVNMDHRHLYLLPAMSAPNQMPMQGYGVNQTPVATQMNAAYQAQAAQMMRPPFPAPFFPPYNPYASAILPLVLFNLLTISLL